LEITLAEGPETGEFAGLRVSVDGTTGTLMEFRPQFHVLNLESLQNEVYFPEQISGLSLPEPVYGTLTRDGIKGTRRIKAFGPTKEAHDELVAQLNTVGIPFEAGEPFHKPEINGDGKRLTLPVVIAGEVDTLHKRALAKILMNFIAWTLGHEEALRPRWNFLRNYVRRADGLIKTRMNDGPFWNGQETETRRLADDSIDIRIENRDCNIVGAIRFYGRPAYEMILAEVESLSPAEEIGFRFTPGSAPIRGERRRTDTEPSSAAP
jgi:hypothetical protein